MDLDYPADTEAFRAEVARLGRHRTGGTSTPGWQPTVQHPPPAHWPRRGRQRLYESGWAVATWPVEYGGRGLSALQATIAMEEFIAAGAPLPRATGGELLLGPTILRWGTDEQRPRYLPPIARGEETWCQGFSEPESGSDLASVRTRAGSGRRRVGGRRPQDLDERGRGADFMFTLAVTDPDGERASWHLLSADPDAPTGHRGSADRAAGRAGRLHRGAADRRPVPGGEHAGRGWAGVAGGDGHARFRTGHLGHRQPPPLLRRVGQRGGRGSR